MEWKTYLVVEGSDDGREEPVLYGLVLPIDWHNAGVWRLDAMVLRDRARGELCPAVKLVVGIKDLEAESRMRAGVLTRCCC